MHVDENSVMDFSAITDFFVESGTPSDEHEENQVQESHTASTPKDQTNGGRIIRRRARKACVECHKRLAVCLNFMRYMFDTLQESTMRCPDSGSSMHQLSPRWTSMQNSSKRWVRCSQIGVNEPD